MQSRQPVEPASFTHRNMHDFKPHAAASPKQPAQVDETAGYKPVIHLEVAAELPNADLEQEVKSSPNFWFLNQTERSVAEQLSAKTAGIETVAVNKEKKRIDLSENSTIIPECISCNHPYYTRKNHIMN